MAIADIESNVQLVEILERHQALRRSALNRAMLAAEAQHKWLGEVIVDEGMLPDARLADILSREFGLPRVDLSEPSSVFTPIADLPLTICRDHLLVPLRRTDTAVQLAVANPRDSEIPVLRRRLSPLQVELAVSPISVVRAAVRQCAERDRLVEWLGEHAPLARANRDNAATGREFRQTDGNRLAANTEDLSLDILLALMAERNASDLHVTAGMPPLMRVVGELQPLPWPALHPDDVKALIFSMLTGPQLSTFEQQWELDFAYTQPEGLRFRVNLFRQRGAPGAIFRRIPSDPPTLEQLGMPPIIRELTLRPRGLILVTGPTGTGKSTTLAAMIEEINRTRAAHIMTIEDPIEFVQLGKRSEINQREVGSDTHSFHDALRSVLRQDPDVIFIGEMRDMETISAALTAAETGHLVLATLHTVSSAQTVHRIIDVFPPHQQEQVRGQLAAVLEGIISQLLVPRKDGKSRCCAQEILVVTPAIRTLIRENKIHQIPGFIQASRRFGMQTMDQALYTLVAGGDVTFKEALRWACQPDELRSQGGGHAHGAKRGKSD